MDLVLLYAMHSDKLCGAVQDSPLESNFNLSTFLRAAMIRDSGRNSPKRYSGGKK